MNMTTIWIILAVALVIGAFFLLMERRRNKAWREFNAERKPQLDGKWFSQAERHRGVTMDTAKADAIRRNPGFDPEQTRRDFDDDLPIAAAAFGSAMSYPYGMPEAQVDRSGDDVYGGFAGGGEGFSGGGASGSWDSPAEPDVDTAGPESSPVDDTPDTDTSAPDTDTSWSDDSSSSDYSSDSGSSDFGGSD